MFLLFGFLNNESCLSRQIQCTIVLQFFVCSTGFLVGWLFFILLYISLFSLANFVSCLSIKPHLFNELFFLQISVPLDINI